MRRGYLALLRPTNCIMIGFAVIVGAGIAAGKNLLSVELIRLVSGFIVGFSFCAVSMIVNDIYDVEIDRANKLDRPLVTGKATISGAYKLSILLGIIGLIFSAITGLLTFIVAIFSIAVGVYYNAKGKKLGFPGNVMVAYNIGIPILYGALIVEKLTWTIMVYWLMVFLTGLGREIVKDIADIEGDKIKGVESLPITHGERYSSIIAVTTYITAILLSPIPIILGDINDFGYGIPVLITDSLLLYSIKVILENPNRVNAMKHKKIVLLAMMSGLVGFLLGNL
ncbi:MAG: UbiA family prenyltransferase [Desulfurococcales archaeon]|nr:UbiA family prenyltransferase [Desulfurococcales archaeon]